MGFYYRIGDLIQCQNDLLPVWKSHCGADTAVRFPILVRWRFILNLDPGHVYGLH